MKLSALLKDLDQIHAYKAVRPLHVHSGRVPIDPELDDTLANTVLEQARWGKEPGAVA